LLQQAGLETTRVNRLILGGPMMGVTLPDPQVPVTKTTNCLIAATVEDFPEPPPEMACIRCGYCADVCPVRLLPQQLLWFARSGELEKAEAHDLEDCIECGACAYVCPSHIPLVQYYRHAKGELREQRHAEEKSERAKQHFERRKARLEAEEAEKEARRKAKAEAAAARAAVTPESAQAATPDAKSLTIAAALARSNLKKAEKRLAAAREAGADEADLLNELARLQDEAAQAEAALRAASAPVS